MKQRSIHRFLAIILSLSLIWTSGGVVDAALTTPDIFVGPSDLPQFQLQPPGRLGRIADYFNAVPASRSIGVSAKEQIATPERRHADTPTHPLVILIQDLHAHYGVQKNIAGILEFLAEKIPVGAGLVPARNINQFNSNQLRADTRSAPTRNSTTTIPFALAVEGASGPIDSSVLALFPDEKVKLAASDYLMREAELTGAEYFAIKRGIPHLLNGIENEKYYLVHRDLFRKTLADREDLVKTLKDLQTDINALPRYVFYQNKALWQFQKRVDAYNKGEISTHDFIGLLVQTAGAAVDLKRDFPTLASFAANSHFGTMDEIRSATGEFLTQTQGQLTAQEKADLKLLAKKEGTSTYYLYLRELIFKKQLFLAVPPALGQYLEYIHTAQTMGMDRVTHEARELAFRIKLGLARGNVGAGPRARPQSESNFGQTQGSAPTMSSNPASDLVQVQHDLNLLLRLADLQATEYEVRDFAPRLNQFVALTKALISKSSTFDEIRIRRLISSSIDFYVMALMRNKPMMENTLALIDNVGAGLRARPQLGSHFWSSESNAKSLHRHFGQTRRSAPTMTVSPRPAVAVLVAGGFHTLQLTTLLREKNISYLVITPTVESVTEADRNLYVRRLSGLHLTVEDIDEAAGRKSPEWVQAIRSVGGPDLTPSVNIFERLSSLSKQNSSLQTGFDAENPAVFKDTLSRMASAFGNPNSHPESLLKSVSGGSFDADRPEPTDQSPQGPPAPGTPDELSATISAIQEMDVTDRLVSGPDQLLQAFLSVPDDRLITVEELKYLSRIFNHQPEYKTAFEAVLRELIASGSSQSLTGQRVKARLQSAQEILTFNEARLLEPAWTGSPAEFGEFVQTIKTMSGSKIGKVVEMFGGRDGGLKSRLDYSLINVMPLLESIQDRLLAKLADQYLGEREHKAITNSHLKNMEAYAEASAKASTPEQWAALSTINVGQPAAENFVRDLLSKKVILPGEQAEAIRRLLGQRLLGLTQRHPQIPREQRRNLAPKGPGVFSNWRLDKLPGSGSWGDAVAPFRDVLQRNPSSFERSQIQSRINELPADRRNALSISHVIRIYAQELKEVTTYVELGNEEGVSPARFMITADAEHFVVQAVPNFASKEPDESEQWEVDVSGRTSAFIYFGKAAGKRNDDPGHGVFDLNVLNAFVYRDVDQNHMVFALVNGQWLLKDLSQSGSRNLAPAKDESQRIAALDYDVPYVLPSSAESLAPMTYLAGAIHILLGADALERWQEARRNMRDSATVANVQRIENELRTRLLSLDPSTPLSDPTAPLFGRSFELALDRITLKNGRSLKREIEITFSGKYEDGIAFNENFLSLHRTLPPKDAAVQRWMLKTRRFSRFAATWAPFGAAAGVAGWVIDLFIQHGASTGNIVMLIVAVIVAAVSPFASRYLRPRLPVWTHNVLNWLFPRSVMTVSGTFENAYYEALMQAAGGDAAGALKLSEHLNVYANRILEQYEAAESWTTLTKLQRPRALNSPYQFARDNVRELMHIDYPELDAMKGYEPALKILHDFLMENYLTRHQMSSATFSFPTDTDASFEFRNLSQLAKEESVTRATDLDRASTSVKTLTDQVYKALATWFLAELKKDMSEEEVGKSIGFFQRVTQLIVEETVQLGKMKDGPVDKDANRYIKELATVVDNVLGRDEIKGYARSIGHDDEWIASQRERVRDLMSRLSGNMAEGLDPARTRHTLTLIAYRSAHFKGNFEGLVLQLPKPSLEARKTRARLAYNRLAGDNIENDSNRLVDFMVRYQHPEIHTPEAAAEAFNEARLEFATAYKEAAKKETSPVLTYDDWEKMFWANKEASPRVTMAVTAAIAGRYNGLKAAPVANGKVFHLPFKHPEDIAVTNSQWDARDPVPTAVETPNILTTGGVGWAVNGNTAVKISVQMDHVPYARAYSLEGGNPVSLGGLEELEYGRKYVVKAGSGKIISENDAGKLDRRDIVFRLSATNDKGFSLTEADEELPLSEVNHVALVLRAPVQGEEVAGYTPKSAHNPALGESRDPLLLIDSELLNQSRPSSAAANVSEQTSGASSASMSPEMAAYHRDVESMMEMWLINAYARARPGRTVRHANGELLAHHYLEHWIRLFLAKNPNPISAGEIHSILKPIDPIANEPKPTVATDSTVATSAAANQPSGKHESTTQSTAGSDKTLIDRVPLAAELVFEKLGIRAPTAEDEAAIGQIVFAEHPSTPAELRGLVERYANQIRQDQQHGQPDETIVTSQTGATAGTLLTPEEINNLRPGVTQLMTNPILAEYARATISEHRARQHIDRWVDIFFKTVSFAPHEKNTEGVRSAVNRFVASTVRPSENGPDLNAMAPTAATTETTAKPIQPATENRIPALIEKIVAKLAPSLAGKREFGRPGLDLAQRAARQLAPKIIETIKPDISDYYLGVAVENFAMELMQNPRRYPKEFRGGAFILNSLHLDEKMPAFFERIFGRGGKIFGLSAFLAIAVWFMPHWENVATLFIHASFAAAFPAMPFLAAVIAPAIFFIAHPLFTAIFSKKYEELNVADRFWHALKDDLKNPYLIGMTLLFAFALVSLGSPVSLTSAVQVNGFLDVMHRLINLLAFSHVIAQLWRAIFPSRALAPSMKLTLAGAAAEGVAVGANLIPEIPTTDREILQAAKPIEDQLTERVSESA